MLENDRIAKLKQQFRQEYGVDAQFVARSPGRVNLIGEHVDYSNYSVLPMALDTKDILIACHYEKSAELSIEVSNVESRFPKRSFDKIDIDSTKHEWSNYFVAGVQGVLQFANQSQNFKLKCLVQGSVPSGAGVSSSSAFVCCSALMMVENLKLQVDRRQLTKIAIKSEQLLGVNIGGMDQSASINGQKDSALHVDFYPELKFRNVKFPSGSEDYSFVVAHSLVTSEKHVSAKFLYNLRVAECRLAALVMAKKLGLVEKSAHSTPVSLLEHILVLRDVQELYFGRSLAQKTLSDNMQSELQKMAELVEQVFESQQEYTMADVSDVLGLSEQAIKEVYFENKLDIDTSKQGNKFRLKNRALHVFTEALRVYQFEEACQSDGWIKLGQLMNQSQTSCRDLFECSHPRLDELIELCRQHGALGSRLTGAGGGGCTVSLIKRSELSNFLQAINSGYYSKYPKPDQEPIFVTTAGQGAEILK